MNVTDEEEILQKISYDDGHNAINSENKNKIFNSPQDNGLDPINNELISGSLEQDDTMIDMKDNNLSKQSDSENLRIISSEIIIDESVILHPKMSREMRNLQKSTQNSKVLSKYLNDYDSPRIRNRKSKESILTSIDVELSNENMTPVNEIPIKSGYDVGSENLDSDSTVIVRDEIGKKRRRSFSRSRTSRTSHRSKSVASRPKSLSRLLSDEMTIISDKEDNQNYDVERTNTTFMNSKPIENRALNAPPKPGWDSFCFKCHLDNAVLSLACKKCKCSLHRHCARLLLIPMPKNPDDFVCADCIEIDKMQNSTLNKYNHPKIDMYTLKEMLITILEKIRNTHPDRDGFENDIQFKSTNGSNQPLIVTQISLKRIEDRIMNNIYKVSEAFLHDMKQLEHNWTIVDKTKIKSLKNILKFVATEINEMEACVYCYSNSFVMSNWFTIPCKRPHLLIWAKLKGYPYWPAKVMSIDAQKLYADVRFFGAHDRAWVPLSHCLIFSEKDPNKVARNNTISNNKGTSKSQKGIADAMKEKDEYIENVREKYGFRCTNTRELLDPTMFQLQLENQLPNLKTESSICEKIESENSQKEKLTLKIVKTSDGTQTVEHKNIKNCQEKEKHILYRVLSKNEEGYESNDQSRVKTIILKRNLESDLETGKQKRLNIDHPEITENMSNLKKHDLLLRRKSYRDELKQRKQIERSRSITPDTQLKRKTSALEEESFLEEIPEKTIKRLGQESCISKIPIDSSKSRDLTVQVIERSNGTQKKTNITSFNRSKSVDEFVDKHNINEVQNNIKSEPLSEEETNVNQISLNDKPKIGRENNNKRKSILISTSDNSNDSFPSNSKARKSFPNPIAISHISVDSLQNTQIGNSNAMVCIPKVFSMEEINSEKPQSPISNEFKEISTSNTHSSVLPYLVPKPSGVFTSEGNTFSQESGAVSALFSENAHRMTDYFKSLLIDTISAISSGVSDAENVLLKLELEKTKQQLCSLKTENQLKIEKLQNDHIKEINILKLSYEEKIKTMQQNFKHDNIKLISEIRQQCEVEKQRAIETTKREIKRVTWCSNCTKEARFYCCWNTSYCGPSCQKIHWQTHQKYCTNQNTSTTETSNYNTNNCKKQNALETITSTSTILQTTNKPVTKSLPFYNNKTNTTDNTHQLSTMGLSDTNASSYISQQNKIASAIPSTELKVISPTLPVQQ